MTLLLLVSSALADPAPQPAPALPGFVPTGDCSQLSGDAQSRCQDQRALNADLLYLATLDCPKLAGVEKDRCNAKTKELDASIAALKKRLAPPTKGAVR